MSVPQCPVLTPTLAEFTDFQAYVTHIRQLYPGEGMVKVVAPVEWQPRKDGYRRIELMVNHPVRQEIYGTAGVYELILVSQRSMTLGQYKEYAESLAGPRDDMSDDQVEELFWKTVRYGAPVYGADTDIETLFDPQTQWNLAELQSTLKQGLGQTRLAGVVTPYLYVGAWKTMFAWHTEDMYLPAINYLHFGKPKFWYAINPADADRFERLAISHFPAEYTSCKQFLRHKCTLISPKLLRKNGIRLTKTVQRPREFILVFERVYHAGFNFGYNAAEAVNFATEDWIAQGRKAKICKCERDNVVIDMDAFEANIREPRSPPASPKKRTKTH